MYDRLRSEGCSESTIGRILGKGIVLGHIRPCAFLRGRTGPRKRRDFSGGHARRLLSGMRASAPGELVQLDHMSVSRDGGSLKEFRAVCPAAKLMFCRVFTGATARNARRFLKARSPTTPRTSSSGAPTTANSPSSTPPRHSPATNTSTTPSDHTCLWTGGLLSSTFLLPWDSPPSLICVEPAHGISEMRKFW